MNKLKILYVDDEIENLQSFRLLFKKDFDITICQYPLEALEILKEESFSIILSDSRMPNMNGIEFLTKAKEIAPNVQRILITGYVDYDSILLAVNQAGISKCIQKPFDAQELKQILYSSCITENKLSQKDLNLLKEMTVFVLDANNKIKFASLAIKNLLQNNNGDILGKDFYNFFSFIENSNSFVTEKSETAVYSLSNLNVNFYFHIETYQCGLENKKIFYGFPK